MSKVKDSEGEPVQRGLANLERRAIAHGWDVPTGKRKRIVKRLLGYLDPKSVDGKLAKPRYVIAAFRALASADLRQRALDLHLLDRIDRPDWRWQRLADNSDAALQLAERVNKLADRRDDLTRIDTSALRATQAIANNRRQTLGRRRAA